MDAVTLLYLTLLYLVVTMAPILAGVGVAVAFGVRSRLLLLMFGLSALGVTSALTFWIYLIAPRLGRPAALFFLIVCLGCIVQGARVASAAGQLAKLRAFGPVFAVYATTSFFNVFLGYLRGGLHDADLTARFRYVAGLPIDNRLPLALAQQVISPVRPLPPRLLGPWQAGDRPPLQTGVYLFERSLTGSNWFVHYEIIGVLCQSLWIFGVWGFCQAARASNKVTALVLTVTTFSGYAIVNTFFVWPKLFPAAYLMLVAAVILTPALAEVGKSVAGYLAVGLCIGFALFGHPGSAMVIIAMVITVLVLRRVPSRRFAIGTIAASAVVYLPWMWFAQFYQPAGDRLLKWQLAGPTHIEANRSLLGNLKDVYSRKTAGDIAFDKWQNIVRPFQDAFYYPHLIVRFLGHLLFGYGNTPLVTVISHIKGVAFYSITATLGLMAIGGIFAIALTIWQRSGRPGLRPPTVGEETMRVAGRSIVCLVFNLLVWALVLAGPGSTVIHDGSFFVELLAFVVGVIGWYAVSPRWAVVAVVAQSIFALYIYGIALAENTPAAIDPHLRTVATPTAVAALIAFVLVLGGLAWVWRTPAEETAPDGSEPDGSEPTVSDRVGDPRDDLVEHGVEAGGAFKAE